MRGRPFAYRAEREWYSDRVPLPLTSAASMPTYEPASRIRRITQPFERAAVFTVVWWVVAEADSESWLFGVPFVALATVASLRLTPSRTWRIRPLGAFRYWLYFVHQSVMGGFDVALRAVRPSLPLDPAFVRYSMRLEAEHARVLFADTVSLLPGTLSTGFEGDVLTLHVLDCGMPVEQSLRDVEARVADVFGLELAEHGGELEGGDCGTSEIGGGPR